MYAILRAWSRADLLELPRPADASFLGWSRIAGASVLWRHHDVLGITIRLVYRFGGTGDVFLSARRKTRISPLLFL